VRAAEGAVRAERVVVCTNAYTTGAVPALARSFYPLAAYGLALAPLPEALRREILPCGGAMMQLPTGFHPVLVDGRGRLVTSLLPGPLRPESVSGPLRDLRRWLDRTYPQARGVALALESYWTGLTAWSPDLLPRIFEAGPGLLSLGCFSCATISAGSPSPSRRRARSASAGASRWACAGSASRCCASRTGWGSTDAPTCVGPPRSGGAGSRRAPRGRRRRC
jgi:glycine/D-amino acid oxidase-like deaminating enzyme